MAATIDVALQAQHPTLLRAFRAGHAAMLAMLCSSTNLPTTCQLALQVNAAADTPEGLLQ
jgi:hypothetical protein